MPMGTTEEEAEAKRQWVVSEKAYRAVQAELSQELQAADAKLSQKKKNDYPGSIAAAVLRANEMAEQR